MSDTETLTDEADGLSDRAAFLVSAVFGLVLATGSVWLVGERAVWFEALNRVRPTIEGGGVAADWEHGIEVAALNWAIDLIHFADVIMGIFILLILFVHWASFHRLAARMRPPEGKEGAASDEAAVTDGGERG